MKSIMISIKPKWCELIANGKKTVEIRKTRPKIDTPFKCYIYCTKGEVHYLSNPKGVAICFHDKDGGKVIGEFVVDFIVDMSIKYSDPDNRLSKREFPYTCMTDKEIIDYLGNGGKGYAWHISELKIYDDPKEITSFKVKDNYRIERCAARERVYNNPDFTNESLLKGSYYCNKYNDFCDKCLTKELTKPPQSWCYVDELR